jgi:lipopolysaccharide assembly outer membrane protein LptD (OstA)
MWPAVARGVVVCGALAGMTAAGALMAQTPGVTRFDLGEELSRKLAQDPSEPAAKSDRVRPELKTPPPGAPVDVIASRITYDADADIAVASGNVVITYGNYVLEARRVVYDRRSDRLAADGEIRLIEPGGNILEADVAELWNRMRDGFARHLRLLLTNDATLTAEYAERRDGAVTVYTLVTYTRCKTCVLADGTPLVADPLGRGDPRRGRRRHPNTATPASTSRRAGVLAALSQPSRSDGRIAAAAS